MTICIISAEITPYDMLNVSDLNFESINLLEEFKTNSSPNFFIVSTNTYVSELKKNYSFTVQNKLLPSSFLLSLSYRPHDNTVLNLLSTRTSRLAASDIESILERGNRESGSIDDSSHDSGWDGLFASVQLSKSTLYLQPDQGRYFPLWTNVSSNRLHNLVLLVSNGSISSCMDGYFIEDNPNIMMWNTSSDIDQHPVMINFTHHLHAIQSQVKMAVEYCILLFIIS